MNIYHRGARILQISASEKQPGQSLRRSVICSLLYVFSPSRFLILILMLIYFLLVQHPLQPAMHARQALIPHVGKASLRFYQIPGQKEEEGIESSKMEAKHWTCSNPGYVFVSKFIHHSEFSVSTLLADPRFLSVVNRSPDRAKIQHPLASDICSNGFCVLGQPHLEKSGPMYHQRQRPEMRSSGAYGE